VVGGADIASLEHRHQKTETAAGQGTEAHALEIVSGLF
jgi:hypothetical protein